MSILVISSTKERQIKFNSFQSIKTKIEHLGNKIKIVCFRIKDTPIIVDQISRDKLLQPNKRYALMGNCLKKKTKEKKKKWRPCGIVSLPKNLSLQNTKEYIRYNVKYSVIYPENTYYLREEELEKIGLLQFLIETNPDEKEIELSVGETALRLCLSKNTEIKLDINDEENRDQMERIFNDLAYLDCKCLHEFIHILADEIIEQMRKTYAQKVTKFFSQNLDKVDWKRLSKNPNISVKFWKKPSNFALIDWYNLSINPGIPVEFFQRYLGRIHWGRLSRNTNIPVKFFEQYLDEIDWYWLSGNPGISVEFFEQHLDKINWEALSANPNIPVKFFQRHLEEVDWETLSINSNIPVEFFDQNLDNVEWKNLSKNPGIPMEFFEQHLDDIDMIALSENTNISVEFIERHLERFNRAANLGSWIALSENPNIPVEFFQQHLDDINMLALSENPNIPVEFFLQNMGVRWINVLSENSNIPIELFQQYPEKINWKSLSSNEFLYNDYALINSVKKSELFSQFSSLWKKEAIKIIRHRLKLKYTVRDWYIE